MVLLACGAFPEVLSPAPFLSAGSLFPPVLGALDVIRVVGEGGAGAEAGEMDWKLTAGEVVDGATTVTGVFLVTMTVLV